jgi:outer membrane protein assembly factor BamA
MRRALFAALLLVYGSGFAADSTVVIRSIDIQGLRLTHRWVVERELQFAVGDTVTPARLDAAQKRLANLRPFSHVNVTGDSAGAVTVAVNELWPIWPVFSAEFAEGQLSDVLAKPNTLFKKVTFYAGVGDLNFLGDAGDLYTLLQFGAATGVDVGYETRWLSPKLPLSLRAEYLNLRASDRHAAVLDSTRHIRNIQAILDVGTHVGAPRRVGMTLQFQSVMTEHLFPATGRSDRVWDVSPWIVLDHRDLEWYPSRGSFLKTQVDVAGGTVNFIRSTVDLRGYFPFTSASRPPLIALGFFAGTTGRSTPEWAHFYHGFNWGLRGYHNILSESSSYLIGDAELRFPITRETTYNVNFLGRWGQNWPWGISGVIFGERSELQYIGRRTEGLAGGAGLYFRIPYLQIIEAGAAFNRQGKTEFTLLTGVYF